MGERARGWLPAQDALPVSIALSVALHLALALVLKAGVLPSRLSSASATFLSARLLTDADSQGGMLTTSATDRIALPEGRNMPSGQEQGAPSASSTTSRGSVPLDPALQRQYYLASRVHKAPTLLHRTEFAFPDSATAREGVVVARVLINESGTVDGVAIDVARPAVQFDAAAMEALLKWQFTPGILHGAPVPTQITVEVRFSASDILPPMFAVLGR